jgi:hypothetical protein
MGADLYISPLFEKQRTRWEPQFEKAIRRRDSLKSDTEEYRQAQCRVEECHEKMYAQGYFRDSYNNSNLLWKFGLSWWNDIIPMLDKDDRLSVQQAEILLEMLAEREALFEQNMEKLPLKEDMYFRQRYGELRDFLNDAIELDKPIDTSL